jgi:hypothetical protein
MGKKVSRIPTLVAGEKNGANSSFDEIWRKNRFSSNVLLQLMEETSGGK